jgi:hypothetical protein
MLHACFIATRYLVFGVSAVAAGVLLVRDLLVVRFFVQLAVNLTYIEA